MSIQASNSPLAGTNPSTTSTAAAEHTYRKVWRRIVPFLFVSYVIAILDRNNIGFAQLQMKQDLGLTDAMYSLGAVIFFVGYFLFEVPSNMLLHRFGARLSFARIMVLWGLSSVLMVLVSDTTHFYLLRFLLGVFEAGFFPGVVFYLTFWFPGKRRAGVLSWFYAGVAVAGVLGGLVSGWIMRHLGGVAGYYGWQWMFALEGAPAVVLGLLALVVLKDRPADAQWLQESEKHLIQNELAAERALHPGSDDHSALAALRNPMVYGFAFVYFCLTSGLLLLLFWMPSMIKDLGIQDIVQISLYSTIPNAVGAVGVILLARHSDRQRERHWHFVLSIVAAAISLVVMTLHPASLLVSLLLLAVAAVSIYGAHPIFWAVPSTVFRGAGAAASIALVSSIGVSSGMITPWIIGQIKTYTGSMDYAFYFVAALLLASAVVMSRLLKRTGQH